MSKKSRKRNRKILGALAAGLGAMALMRGRNKGAVSTVGQPVGVDRMSTNKPPILGTDHIKKVVAADAAANTGRIFEGNTRLKRDGMGPNESVIAQRNIPGHGTAVAPPGILNPYRAPIRMRGRTSVYKHGGKVTGIAKRGFGRALKKK